MLFIIPTPRSAQFKLTSDQEFRADLHAAETKDKKFVKRKTVLKKIVANITMGNDSWYYHFLLEISINHILPVSPLFTDVVQCLGTPLLEIKKSLYSHDHVLTFISDVPLVVYLFLMSYGRSKPDEIHMVIPNLLQACHALFFSELILFTMCCRIAMTEIL